MKAGSTKGLKPPDILKKIGEMFPHLAGKSDWVKLITKTEFDQVMASI